MKSPIAGFHLVRFGTAADQKFLLGEFLSTYDQLIINANMLAHMPSALSSLLSVKARNKPYFIDPQTHAFQHDVIHIQSSSKNREGEIKKSVEKLAQAYGAPITTAVLEAGRSVRPDDFKDASQLRAFCKNVLNFQKTTISKIVTKSDAAKYYKFLEKSNVVKGKFAFAPSLLVAPYFYLCDEDFNAWLEVNVSCGDAAKKICHAESKPVGIQIVLSQEVLISPRLRKKIIEEYSQIKPDCYLLWVDAFSEHEASVENLNAFVDLVEQLGKVAPVINLYGGFFSIVLGKHKLTGNLIGVAHSLEYGEMRGVVPVGGGVPAAKYYVPILHSRLLFRDALRAVRALNAHQKPEEFFKKVCDCKTCKSVIKNNPEVDFQEFGKTKPVSYKVRGQSIVKDYPLPETKDKTVSHFMWSKKKEYAEGKSLDKILSELEEVSTVFGTALNTTVIEHCRAWLAVLTDLKNSRAE